MESAYKLGEATGAAGVEGLHRELALAATTGHEGQVLARHVAARVNGPCVALSHTPRGWRVEGSVGVDVSVGEAPPPSTGPVSWIAARGGRALGGHEIRHAGRVVGLLVVEAGIASEAVAPAGELAAPFFAAATAVQSFEVHCAKLAHELRRPLCTLGLSLELLERSVWGAEPAQGHAERARQALDGLNQLVDDLLTFVAPPRRTRINLSVAQLLDDVVDEVALDAGLRHVRVAVTVRGDGVVLGDEGALSRAIHNMLANALEASPEGATIEVTLDADARGVSLVVRDEGEGVRPDLREKVFEPFFTTRAQGSGLGLAVLKQIAEAHGGSVEFLDGPGGVIRLGLPRVQTVQRQRRGATLAEAAQALIADEANA